MHQPASAVDIPNRELAYLAAWNVYRLIRGLPAEIESNKRKLEAKVIERESTGPPRLIS